MNDPYQVLGVPETASDAEVKKAYLNLARKYHPDNYHDNPLADLAQEKMKEINAAYEEINKRRSGRGGSGGSYGGYGSGSAYQGSYGGAQSGGYGYQGYGRSGSSSVLQQVRFAINSGDLSRAEALLANYSDHNAEWNFLRGAVCYRRGWMDEAKRCYQTGNTGRRWIIWKTALPEAISRAAACSERRSALPTACACLCGAALCRCAAERLYNRALKSSGPGIKGRRTA